MSNPWEYRHIAVWHRLTGSQQYYIDAMQRKAAEQGAPLDSLYRSGASGEWFTLRDLERTGQPHLVDRIRRDAGGADPVRGLGTNDR